MRKLASIVLILLTFFGSAGIMLYQHTCLHERVTINTLFKASDHCASEHREERADSCCESPSPVKEQVKNDHCCNENVSVLNLSFGFFQQFQEMGAILPDSAPEIREYLGKELVGSGKELLLAASDSDPPFPAGRELLTHICIWRL